MSALVEPRLVNPPFGDPGLLLDWRFGRRAVLFDLGDIRALSPREIGRIGIVCVTHRHMDHFSGLDDLVRARLYRPDRLRLFGPAGMIDGVAAKLAAYDWNLLGPESPDFGLDVAEIGRSGPGRRVLFRARDGFRPSTTPADAPAGVGGAGLVPVVEDAEFRIECVELDHGLPVLALALQERRAVTVLPEGLAGLGLAVGPWLTEARRAARRGEAPDFEIDAGARRARLGELVGPAIRVGPGQRIAYVTDAAFTRRNVARILKLAAGAARLFVEAAFLDADAAIARARRHLTARQAGAIAAAAGVVRVTPFHFSPRYLGREAELVAEVERAFAEGGAGLLDDCPA